MKNDFFYCGKIQRQSCGMSEQRGAILVEAMVTVVITAVGLLGIVGMLVAGIASSNKSLYRSSAVYMANEISERMRSNIGGVKANAYVGVGSSSKICRTSPGTPTPSSCSSSELAAYDVYDWKTQIAKLLPGGTGTVTSLASGALGTNRFEIKITWLEDKTSGAQMDFRLGFEP